MIDRARNGNGDGAGGASRALWWAAAAAAGFLAVRSARRAARRLDFDGRVALVMGGSRGLGLQLARRLVDEGARVAICARDADTLERARAELAERAGDASRVSATSSPPCAPRSARSTCWSTTPARSRSGRPSA